MTIEGKVVLLLAEQSGTGQASGKAWRKQSFVVETEEQYPKKVVFDAWNDTVEAIKQLQVGVNLTVHFRAESREYNEKWYTNLTAWKIETDGIAKNTAPIEQVQQDENNDDLPF